MLQRSAHRHPTQEVPSEHHLKGQSQQWRYQWCHTQSRFC
jgi:hypothetical protein